MCRLPALLAMNLPLAAYPPLIAGTAAGAAPSIVTLALGVSAMYPSGSLGGGGGGGGGGVGAGGGGGGAGW